MKHSLGIDELTSKTSNLWKSVLAEFIGIFILNFFSCAACSQANGDLVLIALAFGLSVFMAESVRKLSFISSVSFGNFEFCFSDHRSYFGLPH